MSDYPHYTLDQLTALSYRELQRLSKRDDIQDWATIRLNSSAQQLIKHLETYFQLTNGTINQSIEQHVQQRIDQPIVHSSIRTNDQSNVESSCIAVATEASVHAQTTSLINQSAPQNEDQAQAINQPIPSSSSLDLSMAVPIMKRAPETGTLKKSVTSTRSTATSSTIPLSTHQRSKSAASIKPITALHQRKASQPSMLQSVNQSTSQSVNSTKSNSLSIKPVSRPTAAARARAQIERTASKKPTTTSIKPINKSTARLDNQSINKVSLSKSSKPVSKLMTPSMKPLRQSNIDKNPKAETTMSKSITQSKPVNKPSKPSVDISKSKVDQSVPASAPTRLKRKEPVTAVQQNIIKKSKPSEQPAASISAQSNSVTKDESTDTSIIKSISAAVESASAPEKSSYDDFMRDLSSRVASRTAGPPQVARPAVTQSSAQSVQQSSDHSTSGTSKRPAVKSLSMKFDALHRRSQAASKSIVDVENDKKKRARALSIKQPNISSTKLSTTDYVSKSSTKMAEPKTSKPLSVTNKAKPSALSATKAVSNSTQPTKPATNPSNVQSSSQPSKTKWRFEPIDKENAGVNASAIQWTKPKAFVPPVLAQQFTSQFQ